mmetsp:Transcript_42481/g.122004  ORF Transcript_42481/g.122004 Transcript_42481/m.122004 type:complete len:233 (+) Transcript_42481:643-1341(+)
MEFVTMATRAMRRAVRSTKPTRCAWAVSASASGKSALRDISSFQYLESSVVGRSVSSQSNMISALCGSLNFGALWLGVAEPCPEEPKSRPNARRQPPEQHAERGAGLLRRSCGGPPARPVAVLPSSWPAEAACPIWNGRGSWGSLHRLRGPSESAQEEELGDLACSASCSSACARQCLADTSGALSSRGAPMTSTCLVNQSPTATPEGESESRSSRSLPSLLRSQAARCPVP